MLRAKAIQKRIEIRQTDTIESKISGTWRLVFIRLVLFGCERNLFLFLNRDPGDEGAHTELFGAEGGGV